MIKFVDEAGNVVYELKDDEARPTAITGRCHICGRDLVVEYDPTTKTATFPPCECQKETQE